MSPGAPSNWLIAFNAVSARPTCSLARNRSCPANLNSGISGNSVRQLLDPRWLLDAGQRPEGRRFLVRHIGIVSQGVGLRSSGRFESISDSGTHIRNRHLSADVTDKPANVPRLHGNPFVGSNSWRCQSRACSDRAFVTPSQMTQRAGSAPASTSASGSPVDALARTTSAPTGPASAGSGAWPWRGWATPLRPGGNWRSWRA